MDLFMVLAVPSNKLGPLFEKLDLWPDGRLTWRELAGVCHANIAQKAVRVVADM